MSELRITGWQAIQDEVLRRIHARDWPPGHVIPNEVDLAAEFGCARATVNRALRALAEMGLLERRRKAGTRVALHPVSRATVDIAVIRLEIEARNLDYGYGLITRQERAAPSELRSEMGRTCLHITALHSGGNAPFVHEDRWINLRSVPAARYADFAMHNANEWLLAHAPYTHGDIRFRAGAATADVARHLGAKTGEPVFVIERTTWDHDRAITMVRLTYAPGYTIETAIGPGN